MHAAGRDHDAASCGGVSSVPYFSYIVLLLLYSTIQYCSTNGLNMLRHVGHRSSVIGVVVIGINRLIISTRWRFLFHPFSSQPCR
jgi:hypothetical protein